MNLTLKNIESALAGEAVAHVKYIYFAEICRQHGYHDIAELFDETASQEILHAISHLKLIVGNPDPKECLEMSIAGETYEYTEMYPQYEQIAKAERDTVAELEFKEQGLESSLHAMKFREQLAKAKTIFGALSKVEERHANQYKNALEGIAANG
jgi:rubrerythrin